MKRFMKKGISSAASGTRSMVVAVFVGAALTAAAPNQKAQANISAQAVNDLSRYCQVCWRNARLHPDSWSDCTQEVFARLLERVEPAKWETLLKQETDDRKEFLRAIDAVKKRTQRSKKYAGILDDVYDHRGEDSARNDLREQVERASQEILSLRQQRILKLTCEGWSIPDIANELQTTVERISDEKYKAIRKLQKQLAVA